MKHELKKELHEIIDSIEDEQTLLAIKEHLENFAVSSDLDDLTAAKLQELEKAIEEADNEVGLEDWETFRKDLISKWA
jgi:PHD/YefM family antitoxin component YafN of YafNO toxin-antitoxin module